MAKKLKKKSTPPVGTSITRTPISVSPKNAGGPMDPNLLEQFVRLMRENDVSSLEVSDGPHRISLQRGPQFTAAPIQYATSTPVAAPPTAPVGSVKPPAAAEEDISNLKPIKSPMVGTFYSSPSPDAKAFVQVGSLVTEDSDVCVIEAMKVFNNIKSEVKGTIAKVMVENGKSVEFGTVLFLVKP